MEKDDPQANPGAPLRGVEAGLAGLYLVVVGLTCLWLLMAIFPEDQRREAEAEAERIAQALEKRIPGLTGAQGERPREQAVALGSGADSPSPKVVVAPSPAGATAPEAEGGATVPTDEKSAEAPKPTPSTNGAGLLVPPPTWGIEGAPNARRVILLALLAGAIGGCLHGINSLAAFVGTRKAKRSWLLWYLIRPPVGALLGAMFYFLLRAGLVGGDVQNVNLYGVVALGALAGLFSERAVHKMRELADTFFARPDKGYGDTLGSSRDKPTIESIFPSPVPAGAGDVTLKVLGTGFANDAVVRMDGGDLATQVISATELSATIPEAARPAGGTSASVQVRNPGPTPLDSAARTLEFE